MCPRDGESIKTQVSIFNKMDCSHTHPIEKDINNRRKKSTALWIYSVLKRIQTFTTLNRTHHPDFKELNALC